MHYQLRNRSEVTENEIFKHSHLIKQRRQKIIETVRELKKFKYSTLCLEYPVAYQSLRDALKIRLQKLRLHQKNLKKAKSRR